MLTVVLVNLRCNLPCQKIISRLLRAEIFKFLTISNYGGASQKQYATQTELRNIKKRTKIPKI